MVQNKSVLISGIGIAGPTLAYWLGVSRGENSRPHMFAAARQHGWPSGRKRKGQRRPTYIS